MTWTHFSLRSLCFTIAACSAVLTGIFGSTFGGDNWFLIGICFVSFFCISLLCPLLFNAVTSAMLRKLWFRVGVLGAFALFFGFVDVVTNAGTTALFRATEFTLADNQNNRANNARNDVRRLEDEIKSIQATAAWKGVYKGESGTEYPLTDPKAFDDIIATQRKLVAQEAARKFCGPKCEARQRKLKELIAAQANAAERAGLKTQMRNFEIELKEAKARVAETPTRASAAVTHARNLAAGMTGSIHPGEEPQFWANYGLSALGGLSMTLASIVASILLAFSGIVRKEQPAPWASNPYVTDDRPEAAAAGNQTYIMSSEHREPDKTLEALQLALGRLDKKYKFGSG